MTRLRILTMSEKPTSSKRAARRNPAAVATILFMKTSEWQDVINGRLYPWLIEGSIAPASVTPTFECSAVLCEGYEGLSGGSVLDTLGRIKDERGGLRRGHRESKLEHLRSGNGPRATSTA